MPENRQKCTKCGEVSTKVTLKLISPNNPSPLWPKYVPQIKESCAKCGSYIRFAPQTPELVGCINKQMEGVKLI